MARCYFCRAVPVALLVVLVLELATSRARIATMPAQLPDIQTVSLAAQHRPVDVAALLARPLFSPLRRPAIAAPPPVAQPPRLSGIMVTASGGYAIFVPHGGNPMIAAEGQFIGPFKIREITATQVIVSGPDGMLTLHASDPEAGSAVVSQAASRPPKISLPVTLPGGITLYPATSANLPDEADWSGTKS